MKLNQKGNRLYLDNAWYMVESNGEYRVYNDGEYKGKFCGSLKRLEEMGEAEAFNYVFSAL